MVVQEFRNNGHAGGKRVDMSGVDFTATFSDGTVVTFATPTC